MKYDVTKDKIAIHCSTEELSDQVIDKFIELKVNCCSTRDKDRWEYYDVTTCYVGNYHGKFGYSPVDFLSEKGFDVVSAQDYLDSFKVKKTIAQQLGVKEFPFEIKDKNNNRIYYEDSNGYWAKSEFDKDGNEIYYEISNGYWVKSEFDKDGNKIYYEISNGYIEDNRTKEVSMDEIAEKFGISVEKLKIKK